MTSFLAELAPREQESQVREALKYPWTRKPRAGAWASVVRDLSWTKTSPTTCEDGRPLKML